MAYEDGKALLGAHVPVELAERFRSWARQQDGSTAAALRRLISEAVDGAPPPAPRGRGIGRQIGVRLKAPERAALDAAARQRGTTAANWLRSLAIVHLARKPQWNVEELHELRELFRELRRIGASINQIADHANSAARDGLRSPGLAREVHQAAELIRTEMRRVVALMTGHLDYWGLPAAEHAEAMAGTGAVTASSSRSRQTSPRRARRLSNES